MSSSASEQKTNEEPVKVTNVYDTTQLKNALDDELAKFIEANCGFSQSHQHTDVKLVLGYISVFIAAGSFLYEREYGFDYGKFGTLGCVIAFWFLQAASFLYTRFVQNNEAFVGYLYQGDDHVGTLSVTTNMDRYSPDYHIKYMYSDLKKRKDHRAETTSSAAEWFTEDGTLVEAKFNDQIKASVNSVTKHLHKD
ncbi:signal peptidase complex subunit 2 [Absidia repens]|uniref:Signal peptidase complex subunit 2 n=1 Tax=Absidia repens TaxID=90262 RepID=A0A1X2HXY7_9FUNG|nr:signal peptidase complex subunit 2 [Absidia repens]